MHFENRRERMLTGPASKVSKPTAPKGRVRVPSKLDKVRRKMKVIGKINFPLLDEIKEEEMRNLVKKGMDKDKTQSWRGMKQVNPRVVEEQINHFVPSTPHNTGQYLISNFTRGRKEGVVNILNEYTMYLQKDIYSMMLEDILSVDDICISGGSMKGVIDNKLTELAEIADLAELFPHQDQQTECSNNSSNFVNLDEESTTSTFTRKNSIDEVLQNEYDTEIKSYQSIIETQRKEIENLQTQIKEINQVNLTNKQEGLCDIHTQYKDYDPS